MQRRIFLQLGSLALSLGFVTPLLAFQEATSTSAPNYKVHNVRVISWKPPLYHGWPTLAQRSNGELLLAFSGGRETHVCPFGRLEWMRSKDNGETWGWPQVLYDSPIDDRDAGVTETSLGTILVTTFTSLAYEPILLRAERTPQGQPGAFATPELLAEWRAIHGRSTESERQSELGSYMMRSTDGGITWSARYRVPMNSPHGPVNLSNGRLIYPGKSLYGDDRIGIWESMDDGISWQNLSWIPVRQGDSVKQYHELHAVEAADGTLFCHIRNENPVNKNETLQSESHDGGKIWTMPHPIGVWGLPSHLLRLRDGRLLMTYGHRRKPLGIQGRLSTDHGRSWSEPMFLTQDASSADLGYPSTVECENGMLVTVWYEVLAGSPLAQIRQARWELN